MADDEIKHCTGVADSCLGRSSAVDAGSVDERLLRKRAEAIWGSTWSSRIYSLGSMGAWLPGELFTIVFLGVGSNVAAFVCCLTSSTISVCIRGPTEIIFMHITHPLGPFGNVPNARSEGESSESGCTSCRLTWM